MPEQTQIPRVLWAQQHEHILLTIAVPDIEKVDVKFEEDSVSFQGHSSSNPKGSNAYAVKIDLYEKIDPETSKYEIIGQKFWRLLLKKKDAKGAFWPRLTKDKSRLHWLQTDFDHWKDEDESDDEKAGPAGNFQDMFSGGMGGMPGMGGMGGMPGMMGGMPGMGMGGMPGMGMGGMPGMGMGGDDEDEEEDYDDEEEASPETNGQESKKSNDEPIPTTSTGGEATDSKEQSA
ncbi:unnamed protein product [Rotaria socialis]|uniref:CS domain-containing protein n=2 Tax=Rotaria socialis TaxID=392032 RepID=A0A820LIG8_9BILA|nr:unnamed protein product [Rotaria socialis]CAF3582211.1 unnamed protein product [Rotaria socialis]CAF4357892.1 unnamed protein product [Rotaria socialis]CAF4572694.1 unnamed protein product [Rotaria socialis]